MKKKKYYIAQLGAFLASHKMTMSGTELADNLNRNGLLTSYDTEYKGGRGKYKLISVTWHWLNDELDLPDEAKKVADAFVKDDGTYAYEE